MNRIFVAKRTKDQIFEAVCQRAANGHNDLLKTARELLDVSNDLFSETEIQERELVKTCPPPPREPIAPKSFRGDL